MTDLTLAEQGRGDIDMMNSESRERYVRENYPGLLFISQLPTVREFSYKVYQDGRVEVAVQNDDFSSQYSLRKAQIGDFTPFWVMTDAITRGGYLVAERVDLKGFSGEHLDIMPQIKEAGTTLFIDGLCPQLAVFTTNPARIEAIDEDIREDVLDSVYGAYGFSQRGSLTRGCIISSLPVNTNGMFILAHEIGHQQKESFKNHQQVTEMVNDSTKTEEERDRLFDRLTYQDERFASAYGLKYMRTLYDRLGIQKSLGEMLPMLAHVALYMKQTFFQQSSLTSDIKPPPLPRGEKQIREYRIALTIKSLVSDLR